MLEFLFLLGYRALSGLQNGLGYGKSDYRPAATVLLMIAAVITGIILRSSEVPILAKFTGYALALVALFAALMVDLSFSPKRSGSFFDIHLWEGITTGCLTLVWLFTGANIMLIGASVYPGLILHKGFINILGGNPFFYQGTDDPSGRTFNIPFLGLKITRGSNAWRWMLTGFSIVLALMTFLFDWQVRLFPFAIDLFGNR